MPATAEQGCGEPPDVRSNLLLAYEEARGVGVVLTGWTQTNGHCEVWEQPTYHLRVNRSEVVSCLPDGSTAGVVFQVAGVWYLALAATYSAPPYRSRLKCEPSLSDEATVITVRKVVDLLTKEDLGIIKRKNEPLHFVDALQWGDHFFFPYYKLKARQVNNTEPPSMAVLRQLRSPSEGGLTLKGHVYLECGCRGLIVSSSLVRQDERGWWVGVFRHSRDPQALNDKAWNDTAICIFGMEEVKEQACALSHFDVVGESCEARSIKKLPTLIHSGLVVVYGTVVLNQIVLFLGTDDGQLLKTVLNEHMESSCPEVLYEIEEETSIFPKLRLDPIDSNYIYLSSANKVAVAASISKILTFCVIKIVKPVEVFYENVVLKNSSCFCNLTTAEITDDAICLFLDLTWRNADFFQDSCNATASEEIATAQKTERISIHSIEPLWISTLGKSEVTVKGENFTRASGIKMILTGMTGCKPEIGGRKITTIGRNFKVVDRVIISDDQRSNLTVSRYPGNESEYHYLTPSLSHATEGKVVDMMLKVETTFIPCFRLRYHPDPVFINYQLHTELDPDLELKIYKENDNLNISKTEVEVYLSYMNGAQTKKIWFSVQNITKKPDRSTILCKFKREATDKIDFSTVKVFVKLGNFEHEVKPTSSHIYLYVLILLPIIVGVIIVAFVVTRYKSKELTRKQSQQLELLEYEIRKEIREGGFASIFSEDMPQSRDQTSKDESFNMLHALICNKNFLVTLIHTLEKQKNFTVKDRCLFASFLTIALQTKLVYLTHILEVLTKDLMDQSSNVQPKLLLRRTESVVEKLLTNWMSVCLSGFLRETIGEPFYLLVTTLNQRINKGPVDAITCKALYTLNEDWLLWQVSEFKTVTVNVIFEKIPENESGDACQTIQVNVLDCDTIGQAKEKSLQAFLNKNGFPYGLQLDEIGLELVSEEQQRELLDIDGSSEVMEDGIRKLNTISHYEISNGATIKVFKKKTNTRSDVDYSDEHCHLILPDSEANKDMKGAGHKGKQKFKVKEMYLTKLLSTKVAIHSVVEKLFRSIWSLPNNKAPVAIKYFFDFLDAQAESKKITDPDVVHIWKTNSLPLRFWVNILKNPQFVFDIKKTSHIDGCLSVIAQAFMDAFSLAEQTLGKEAPTNKLLYAKDIPLYKKEVKAYYKAIRDLPPLTTSEVEEFLTQESKKHENEFNEKVALIEIHRYIVKYYDEIVSKLERERGFEEVQKQLQQVKALFDEKKKCKWL
ncbi:plexin-c1 [Limosa lapponica baueri]|uniref:Plexin-c1 n=1 Tax=Limosa lapponica baueri TaxID=1758121 RepID=A0A2I0UMJ8_LIMLA|nr:plexin-c1 [Limosa lapponica baueri]